MMFLVFLCQPRRVAAPPWLFAYVRTERYGQRLFSATVTIAPSCWFEESTSAGKQRGHTLAFAPLTGGLISENLTVALRVRRCSLAVMRPNITIWKRLGAA
jgi:hypothetical protein